VLRPTHSYPKLQTEVNRHFQDQAALPPGNEATVITVEEAGCAVGQAWTFREKRISLSPAENRTNVSLSSKPQPSHYPGCSVPVPRLMQ
jgi:hypothetical protein